MKTVNKIEMTEAGAIQAAAGLIIEEQLLTVLTGSFTRQLEIESAIAAVEQLLGMLAAEIATEKYNLSGRVVLISQGKKNKSAEKFSRFTIFFDKLNSIAIATAIDNILDSAICDQRMKEESVRRRFNVYSLDEWLPSYLGFGGRSGIIDVCDASLSPEAAFGTGTTSTYRFKNALSACAGT